MFTYAIKSKNKMECSDHAMIVVFICTLGLVVQMFFWLKINPMALVLFEFIFNMLLSYSIYSISKYKNIAMILYFFSVLMAASCAFAVMILIGDNNVLLVYLVTKLCYLCLVVYLCINYVFTYKKLSSDKIFGMLGAYFLLVVAWATLYSITYIFISDPFYLHSGLLYNSETIINTTIYIPQMIYYSFVTFTSLALGDIVPITPITRTLATIEVMMGKFFIAILIARVVQIDIEKHSSQIMNKIKR